MSYFKKRFEVIKGDSFLTISICIVTVLLGMHVYQYIDSGLNWQPLARLVCCALYPLVVFFAGRAGSMWFFFVYGNLLANFTTFQNYTAFIILCVFGILKPRMKWPTFVIYACEIIGVATRRDKTPVHIAIHILNCILIYIALFYLIKPTVNNKKLVLTPDEIYIIEELLVGKQQKEIERFSANTVTNKLRAARDRNGLATTDELLNKYMTEVSS